MKRNTTRCHDCHRHWGEYNAALVKRGSLARQARAAIPPRRGVRIWQPGNAHAPPLARDENRWCIRRMGRKRWQQAGGYHWRSLPKTALFGIKTLFGERVHARTFVAQGAALLIRCAALNRMTHLRMPDSNAA